MTIKNRYTAEMIITTIEVLHLMTTEQAKRHLKGITEGITEGDIDEKINKHEKLIENINYGFKLIDDNNQQRLYSEWEHKNMKYLRSKFEMEKARIESRLNTLRIIKRNQQ